MNDITFEAGKLLLPFIMKFLYDFRKNSDYIHGKSVKKYQKIKIRDYFFMISITLSLLLVYYFLYQFNIFYNETLYSIFYILGLILYGLTMFIYMYWKMKKGNTPKFKYITKGFNKDNNIANGVTQFCLILSFTFSATMMPIVIEAQNFDNKLYFYISVISTILIILLGEILLLKLSFDILLSIFSNPDNIYVHIESNCEPIVCDNVYLNDLYYVLYKSGCSNPEHNYILIPKEKVISISFNLSRVYS